MNNQIEWRAIENYPGYEVSNDGRVKSLDRFVITKSKTKCFSRFLRGYELKNTVCSQTRYFMVSLSTKNVSVHRLVAIAFIKNYQNKPQVNHIDGNRQNNNVSNLEWVTASENQQHSWDFLGRKNYFEGRFSQEHSASKAVIATCMKTGKETFFHAGMDAVRLGFRSDSISRACNGIIRHHAKHYWRFADERLAA